MVQARRMNIFPILNYVFFGFFNIIMIYPLWHSLIGSMISYDEYIKYKIMLYPHKVDFSAYQQIFQAGTIFNPMKNTVFITIFGTILSLCVTAFMAYGLSKQFALSRFIMSMVVLTMFINGGIIPTYAILQKLGLINNILVLILPSLVNTFYLIIMRTYFIGFPSELEDSSRIDGCSVFRLFFNIVLPLSKPILATIGLFYAVSYWNTFLPSIIFITDKDKKTLYEYIYRIVGGTEGSEFTQVNIHNSQTIKFANITLAVAPIIFVYPFLQKYFINGIMLGAVKA